MIYFKVFKSTWGLIIGFDCDICNYENFHTDLIQVTDLIFIKNNSNIVLSYEFIQLLKRGVIWANSKLIRDQKHQKFIIEIKKIEFNAFDYQKEMFFFGIANWFCGFFNIEMPIYDIKYDQQNKTYIFDLFDEELNSFLNSETR